MANSGINKLMPIIVVLVVFMASSLYMMGILSSHSQVVDVNNTSLSEVYETQQNEQSFTLGLMPLMAMVLVLAALFMGVRAMWK